MKSDPDPLMSVTEAAEKIGVNRSTLFRQIKAGAVRNHDGKVRLSELLADRAANIDLTRSRRGEGKIDQFTKKGRAPRKPRHAAAADATAGATVDATSGLDATADATADATDDTPDNAVIMVDGEPMTYASAKAMKETYLAHLKRLEYEKARGDLAPVQEMVEFNQRMLSVARDRFLTISGKMSGRLNFTREQIEFVTSELYEAMEDMSDPRTVLDLVESLPRPDSVGDDDAEAAPEAEPRRVGRAVPVRRPKDERRAR